ncbi:MAG TPA: AIR synthase family protein [Candidatus Eisenbacteria bacterium]|nr:AIR synthase family protein [Candidatus Eisenbacteria bacterium]
MPLPPGKIPVDILKQIVFKNLGATRKEVILGPAAGIDCAVINLGNKSLIAKTDPITGALERIGWLAVNVNANDVSTFGVEPAFFLSCILLPEKANKKTVEIISTQMDKAARELGMAIIGGHCETTPGLKNPIVVGCAMGVAEKNDYVTAAGAKAGDWIILTKTAGIEGTAILASDRENKLSRTINASVIKKAQEFFSQISVTKEALTAYKTGGVHAMHDPTEGGVAGGIHEMADASNLGFKIYEEKVPIASETIQICKSFEIDPFYLIASGSMLIAANRNSALKIVRRVKRKGILATVVGEFLPSPEKRTMIFRDGTEGELARPICDQLWMALAKS